MIRSSCHPSAVIARGEKDVSGVCAVGTEAQLASVCVCVFEREASREITIKIEVPLYSFGVG